MNAETQAQVDSLMRDKLRLMQTPAWENQRMMNIHNAAVRGSHYVDNMDWLFSGAAASSPDPRGRAIKHESTARTRPAAPVFLSKLLQLNPRLLT